MLSFRNTPVAHSAHALIRFARTMSKPIRIQLSRRAGWRKPPNTVVVARPSKWGNPFPVAKSKGDLRKAGIAPDAATAVDRFRSHLLSQPALVSAARAELRGRNLACWCKLGTPCHADVLLEVANA